MKLLFIPLFVLALLVPRMVSAQGLLATGKGQEVIQQMSSTIKKGATATVPGWKWVDVKNSAPLKIGKSSFGYGETCGIQRGGVVTVVGIEGDRILVRYSMPGLPSGTACPSGVLFFTDKRTFSGMTAEHRRIDETERAEKSLVERLTGKKE
jgi:hypothetical protein